MADKQLEKLKEFLLNNLIWILLLFYSLLLPYLFDADISIRIALLLSFLSLFTRVQPVIIVVYSGLVLLAGLLTGNYTLPEDIAVHIGFFLVIFLCTEFFRPYVRNLVKKTHLIREP